MSLLKKATPYLISGLVAVALIVVLKKAAPSGAAKLGL